MAGRIAIAVSLLAPFAFASVLSACLTDTGDDAISKGDEGQVAKDVVVKEGCKLADITQKPQLPGSKPVFKPPGIFQNNGKPSGVDQTEQDNAAAMNGKGGMKALHGSPGGTEQPLPTDGELGMIGKPIVDSICYAASAGANGCSVLAQECAVTGGDKGAAAGSVYACTGKVYVLKDEEYCQGDWIGCDGKAVATPFKIGGLNMTSGGGVPKAGECKCPEEAPPPTPVPGPGTTIPPTTTNTWF